MAIASVKTKLIGLTLFFMADLAAVGALSYTQEKALIAAAGKLADVSLPSSATMADLDMMHDGLRANVFAALLFSAGKSSMSAKEIEEENADFAKKMREDLVGLAAMDLDPELKAKIQAADGDVSTYIVLSGEVNALALGGKHEAAYAKSAEFAAAFEKLEAQLGEIGEDIEKSAKRFNEEQSRTSEKSLVLMLTVLGFGLGIGAIVAFVVVRSTMRGVSLASSALIDQASSVARFAAQADAAGSTLASTVDVQASNVQRAAATMHEIAEMARLSADSANAVRDAATSAVEVAATGKSRVSDMALIFADITKVSRTLRETTDASNQQMAAVAKLIQEIATKTQVINEIVFQTKLLSFNASVEAARAGEHGKGFAVVAEEVGNLARSSGAAATEISSMLASSVRNVESGVQDAKRKVDEVMRESAAQISRGEAAAQECGRVLDQVVAVSQGVQVKVDQISGAIKEQSTGVDDLAKALQDLEGSIATTRQEARASAEQATGMTAASESMRTITASLRQLLGVGEAPANVGAPTEAVVESRTEADDPSNAAPKAA